MSRISVCHAVPRSIMEEGISLSSFMTWCLSRSCIPEIISSKCQNHNRAKCIGRTNAGALLIRRRVISVFRVFSSVLCSIHLFKCHTFTLCWFCIDSLESMLLVIGSAVVIHMGSRLMPPLSLCLISVLTILPSRSNFPVPSKRAHADPGSWSRWNPLLSLSRGICSGLQTPIRLSMIKNYPAFVYPCRTAQFTFI